MASLLPQEKSSVTVSELQQLNVGKFQALHYRPINANININTLQPRYTGPGGIAVPESQSVRDLGIYMSNDASFHAHVTKMAVTCRRLAGWILRAFRTRDQETMLVLWRTFVLSRLDYCSQLWSPHSVKLTAQLEAIQRCYTKRIASVQHLSYWERLRELKKYTVRFLDA